MITLDQLTEVGQLFKPHGIKGEMSAELDFELKPDDVRCFLIDRDGIFVPFFVAESRRRGGESWLIRLDGVNNENDAAKFTNTTLYALTCELPSEIVEDDADGVHLYDLVDFDLFNDEHLVGRIKSIDDSTANILFSVETTNGDSVLVPFAEDLITGLDPEARTITLSLPDGIVDLN